jgi:lysozyme family protein
MRGITLATYTRWQQAWGKPTPTKAALHAITDVEVRDIYHLWYWLGSGADKLPWPLCLAHFDLAVNGGVARGDFVGYMARRIDWYTRLKTYPTFGTAWIRRCADLMLEAIKAG